MARLLLFFSSFMYVCFLSAALTKKQPEHFSVRALDPFVMASCITVSSPGAPIPHKLAFRATDTAVSGCLVAGHVMDRYKADIASQLLTDSTNPLMSETKKPLYIRLAKDIAQKNMIIIFFRASSLCLQTSYVASKEGVISRNKLPMVFDPYNYFIKRDFRLYGAPANSGELPSLDRFGLIIKIDTKTIIDHLKTDELSDDF